jgi:hypothetical protein
MLLIPDRPTAGRPAVNRRIVVRIHVGERAAPSTSRTCVNALQITACGGAWSPRLPRTEETGGSNPPALTIFQRSRDSLRDWARIASPATGGDEIPALTRTAKEKSMRATPDVRLSLFTTRPDADRHTCLNPFSKTAGRAPGSRLSPPKREVVGSNPTRPATMGR